MSKILSPEDFFHHKVSDPPKHSEFITYMLLMMKAYGQYVRDTTLNEAMEYCDEYPYAIKQKDIEKLKTSKELEI